MPAVRAGLRAASEKHPDIVFGKVDTEAQPELAAKFDIQSIPTIMAIRDGVIVFAQPGALPETALESLIEQVRALDMDEVRAKSAAAHGADRPRMPSRRNMRTIERVRWADLWFRTATADPAATTAPPLPLALPDAVVAHVRHARASRA